MNYHRLVFLFCICVGFAGSVQAQQGIADNDGAGAPAQMVEQQQPQVVVDQTSAENAPTETAVNSQEEAPVVQIDEASVDQNEEETLPPSESAEKLLSSRISSLELKDMDINDVLKLIASKTGLNIIAGRNISGRVSLFVQNIDVRDALTVILDANGLAYGESMGIVKIMTAAEYEQMYGRKFGQNIQSKIIPLKTMKAADAVTLLSQIKSPTGKIIADEGTNTLFLEDVPSRLTDMAAYLEKTDVPVVSEVFRIEHVSAEGLQTTIEKMLTPKLGASSFDAFSNKIFVKDTPAKLAEVKELIKQIDLPMTTELFDINYAKAEDVLKTVTNLLTKDIGRAQFDSRSNSLIVTDIPPRMEEIRKVIAGLDKYEKEVLIEARIVQIVLKDGSQMGVDWEGIVSKYQNLSFGNDYTLGDAVKPKSTVSIGTLSEDKYAIVLQAINTMGKSKTLSNPRIAVLNNQEAKILVGSSKAYVTSTTTTTSGAPSTTAESVNFIDLGVKLAVTPTIHEDGFITMKIKPEVSSATTDVVTSEGNKIPVKDTSELETVVRVKDGVTIIMGGLIKDEISNNQSKVPVLGDVPLLGKAFRNEDKSVEKTEIVIFLTPRIITGDVDQAAVAHTTSEYPILTP